jgi:stage V sporulation protein G
MEITDVKISIRNEERLKAYASIVFDDCFIVKDLRVIDGTDRLWVAMPNKKRRDGTRRDVCHPLNTVTREMIEKAILDSYDEAMREQLYTAEEADEVEEVDKDEDEAMREQLYSSGDSASDAEENDDEAMRARLYSDEETDEEEPAEEANDE